MSKFPDWTSILPGSGALLRLVDDPDFHWSRPSKVRGFFLRLDEIVEALPTREDPGDPLAVYVDVLRIESAVQFRLNAVTLHARRIEVGVKAALGIQSPDDSNPACRIEIYADEWAFEAKTERLCLTVGNVPHDLTGELAGGGVDARVEQNGSVHIEEVAAAAQGDVLTGQLELNAAKRLVYRPDLDPKWSRELPLQMADWVGRTGGDALLSSDARAYAAHLRTPRGNTHFVPYLQLKEYAKLAQTTQSALQTVEQEYRNLFSRTLAVDDQKQAARNMLEHYRAEKRYSDQLLKQAGDEAALAATATDLAQKKLEERSDEISAKQKLFDKGIEAKKAELERKAIFNIALGIVAVGAGIATVWFTGPAGAGVAAAGAAEVAAAGAKTAEQVGRLVKLIKMIAKLLEAIKKIKGYYELLKAAFDSIHDPLEARKQAEAAGKKLPKPLSPDDIMSAADWDEFVITLDGAFQPALDQGIAGAKEYLAAMKKLAIRGKDLVSTQTNLDRTQQILQQRLWQTLRDDSDLKEMEARIKTLDEKRGPGSVLMTYYGQLRDRLKFRLIHAIENLSDAYRYEALLEPKFTPNIASSGADLAKMTSDIQQALVDARDQRGTISDWGPEGPPVEQNSTAIASMQQTGSLSWVVDASNFNGLDRIRVHDIRIWLQGTVGVKKFYIAVSTPGDYLDRVRGKQFEFTTWPLSRVFRYELDPNSTVKDHWGEPVRITLHANHAKGEGDYFEPTAFTTWIITLPKKFNPRLEPSKISGVALEFVGTAMAASSRMLGAPRKGAARKKESHFRKVITL